MPPIEYHYYLYACTRLQDKDGLGHFATACLFMATRRMPYLHADYFELSGGRKARSPRDSLHLMARTSVANFGLASAAASRFIVNTVRRCSPQTCASRHARHYHRVAAPRLAALYENGHPVSAMSAVTRQGAHAIIGHDLMAYIDAYQPARHHHRLRHNAD